MSTLYVTAAMTAAASAFTPTTGQVPPVDTTQRQHTRLVTEVGGWYVHSPVSSWTNMLTKIEEAARTAADDGNPLSLTAKQLALEFAAHSDVAGAPRPAVSDNEEGGMVFYWVAGSREIQVEIDGDTSYFIRIKDASGAISFIREGYGTPPVDSVKQALGQWRDALSRSPFVRQT